MSDRGGELTRDILLRVRAQNLTNADFKQIQTSINEVTTSIDRMTQAAARGEVKERELGETLTKVGQAVQGLANLQTAIKTFEGFPKQLEAAEKAAAGAAETLRDHQAVMRQAETVTRTMTEREERLQRAYESRQNTIRNLRTQQAEYSALLQRQGLDVNNLVAAENQLIAVADQARVATQQLTDAKSNYASIARRTKEAQEAEKKAAIENTRAQEELTRAFKEQAAARAASLSNMVPGRRESYSAELKAQMAAYDATRAAEKKAAEDEKARIKERQDVQIRANQINYDLELQRIQAGLKARQEAIEKQKDAEKRVAAEREAANAQIREREVQETARAEARIEELRRRNSMTFRQRLREDYGARRTMLQGSAEDEKRIAAREETGQGTQRRGLFDLRPYELTNLGYQATDVIQGGLSGVSPAVIAAQQGPQIVQIFGASILKWSPIIVAGLGAITVAVGALNRSFREQAATREFGAAMAGNVNTLNYNKQQLVDLTKAAKDMGMSWTDATASIKTAMSQNVGQGNFKTLLQAAQDAADLHGDKVPEAMKKFSTALTGSADDILKLNNEYNFLNREQTQYVRDQFAAGNAEDARRLALQQLSDTLRKGAKEAITPWTEATRGLSKAWDDLLIAIGNTTAFKTVNGWITDTIKGLTSLLESSDKLRTALPANAGFWERMFPDWAKSIRGKGTAAFESIPPLGTTTAVPGSAAGGGTAGFGAGSRGENEKIVRDYLVRQGYSSSAIAGIMGNIAVESSFNPAARNPTGHFGIAQWDQNRQAALQGSTDLTRQLELLDKELSDLDPSFKKFTGSVEDASVRFEQKFERSGGQLNQQRIDAARQYAGVGGPAAPVQGAPTSTEVDKGQKAVQQDKERLAIDNARTVEAQRQAEYAKLDQEISEKTQDAKSQATLRESGRREIDRKLALQEDQYERERRKQAQDDARHLNEIQAAGQKAVAEAQAKGETSYTRLRDVRKRGEDEERDRLSRIDQENAKYQQVVKTVDDLKRANDSAFSTDVEKRVEAVRLKYKDIENTIKKARDESPLTGRARYDEQLTRLPAEQRREESRAEGQGLLAQAQAAASARQDLISSYKTLREEGAISISEEQDKTKQAFAQTTPEIEKALAALEKWLERAKELGVPALEIEKTRAKMAELRAQSQYVDPLWKGLVKTAEDSLGTRGAEAFDTIAEAIGGAIAKTKEWKDVWVSLKSAAANFFAGVLKDIAQYIIKAELAKLASSFASSFGGGAAGAAGSAASAAAAGTASQIGAVGASTGMSTGWASILSGAAAVVHGGGVVGVTQLPTRAAPGSWFDRAPRYHNGSPMVGLAANEQAAILQRGEEVVTADNPRHIRNWGGGGSSGGRQPDINIRNVLVADPDLVPSHMASSRGEKIIMSTLTRNAATVRQLVR